MKEGYKPPNYNSASPYFIVNGAQKLIDFLVQVFDAVELRRYDNPDGTIMHAEFKVDDTVLMLGEASEIFPAVSMVMHVYVPDVDSSFHRAINAGCTIIEKPTQKENDPDKRATFKDFAGNIWSVGTMNA